MELRTKLEKASAAHDDTMRQVAKWQAAQLNVRRLGEQLALRELEAELDGYTAATVEAKTDLNQAQAALAQAQQRLDNLPTQIKAAEAKLQSQLDTLGRENNALDALGQLFANRKKFQSKMTATAKESAELVTNDPENKNLAKAAELLNESITLLGKDIESIQARIDSQQQKTDASKATLVGTQQ